jgi:hypothetical protein
VAHLVASFWGLIIMSLHIGTHMGMIVKMPGRLFHKLKEWLISQPLSCIFYLEVIGCDSDLPSVVS